MIKALYRTLNPKRGHGMIETIIFFIMIVALITFNMLEIAVDPLFEKIIMLMVGYVVGNNTDKNCKSNKKAVNEVEQRRKY